MKTLLYLSAVAVFLVVAPGQCFALWEIAEVSKEKAKEMGMEVRSTAAGPNDVRVELEFKPEGPLETFSRVEMRIDAGQVTASLKEDRSKPGRVAVSFSANRSHLDKINLWVMAPGFHGGTIYEVRVKDFIELEKGR